MAFRLPQKEIPSKVFPVTLNFTNLSSSSHLVYFAAATMVSFLFHLFCKHTPAPGHLHFPFFLLGMLPPENCRSPSFSSGLCSDGTVSVQLSPTSFSKVTSLLFELPLSSLCFILSMVLSLSLIFSLVYLLFLGRDFALFITLCPATRQVSGT